NARGWYTHSRVRRAYLNANGDPYGHPLAGYGHEHRLEAHATLLDARLRLAAAVLTREREPDNRLWHVRPGRSHGGFVNASYRVSPRLRVEAGGLLESGERGWREAEARLGLRALH